MVNNILVCVSGFINSILLTIKTNPWEILKDGNGSDKAQAVSQGVITSLWKLMMSLGIIGAALSILIYALILGMTKNSEKRAGAKSGLVIKFIVIFCIFAFVTIVGLIGNVVSGLLG